MRAVTPDDPVYQATALGEAYRRITRLPVTILLDQVRSLYNVGAFFRTADAVRAERDRAGGHHADAG